MKQENVAAMYDTISVAKEIVELINSPSTRVTQLSAVLTKDPVLMKSILRRANSPVYGFRERISDINLAIILLGFDVLKKTIASTIISNTLRKVVTVLSEYDAFWQHSLHTALLAQTLAEELQCNDPSDAFTAGLLHDIGYIAEQLQIPLERRSDVSSNHVINDHALKGFIIAAQWDVPDHILEVIRYHHTPINAQQARTLAAVVHIADVFSCKLSKGQWNEDNCTEICDSVYTILDVAPSVFNNDNHSYVLQRLENTYQQQSGVDFMTMLRTTIINALSELPEKERIVLALRYYDGLSYSEIGQLCGYDAGTAEELHKTALRRLRNSFVPKRNERGVTP